MRGEHRGSLESVFFKNANFARSGILEHKVIEECEDWKGQNTFTTFCHMQWERVQLDSVSLAKVLNAAHSQSSSTCRGQTWSKADPSKWMQFNFLVAAM
jgi:hypothetical protein